MFRDLIESIRRDITGALPGIVRGGRLDVQDIVDSGRYSRTQLRKLGLIPDKWKKLRKYARQKLDR